MTRLTSPTGKRLSRWMRKRGWGYTTSDNGLRSRLYALTTDHHPWWDWGHPLMILVGRNECGNWSEPRPATWWYRLGPPKRMWRTGYPRHPLSTFQVVTDYAEFTSLTKGLNEDQMYEWQAIYVSQDGELSLGHRYWGGTFFGLSRADTALLRRYLRTWRRLDWFGLRSWLYAQGLHAAVHTKKPFACNQVPPRGQGGYDHWHCKLKRRHDGMHRVGNYVWGEIDGEPIGARFEPEEDFMARNGLVEVAQHERVVGAVPPSAPTTLRPTERVAEDAIPPIYVPHAFVDFGNADLLCTGSRFCDVAPHIHGCFADEGDCDHPEEHGL